MDWDEASRFIDDLHSSLFPDQEGDELKVEEIVEDILDDVVAFVLDKHFVCKICDQKCRDKHNLESHRLNNHNGEATCQVCLGIFPDKYQCKLHKKDCVLVCPEQGCSKQFTNRARYEGHQRAHIEMARRML